MGNELILALPEGADDFVVYYDARSKDLEAGLEKEEEALSERDVESDLYGSNEEPGFMGASTNLQGLEASPDGYK
ncbi:hypothetical protein Tco_1513744 [Tanacetum coccineum]